jgi:hypothetical protein
VRDRRQSTFAEAAEEFVELGALPVAALEVGEGTPLAKASRVLLIEGVPAA